VLCQPTTTHVRRFLFAAACSVIGGLAQTPPNTSQSTRKRKVTEADNYLSPAEEPLKKKKTSTSPSAVDLPVTPTTPATEDDYRKMDSDDDFNSSMSGADFDEQDSDDLGLEEGIELPTCSPPCC
jgi:ariadne-1